MPMYRHRLGVQWALHLLAWLVLIGCWYLLSPWLATVFGQTFCSQNGPYTNCMGPDASMTTITQMPGGYTRIDTIPYGARPVVPPTVLTPHRAAPRDRPLSRYLDEPSFLRSMDRRESRDADDAEFEQLLRELER